MQARLEKGPWLLPRTPPPHGSAYLCILSSCLCQVKPVVNIQRTCSVLSHFSCIQLFATLWIVAHQAPLSMGFSRQEYWTGLPCPSPGGLPNPGIGSSLAGGFFAPEPPGKPLRPVCMCAKSLPWSLTLCNPMDRSPPGSSVYGILQARALE